MEFKIFVVFCLFFATFPSEIVGQGQEARVLTLNETLIANGLELIEPFKSEIREWFWSISGMSNPRDNGPQKPKADFIDCNLCSKALPALRGLVNLNISEGIMVGVATAVCIIGNLAPKPEICQPTIESYVTSVLFMITNRPDLLISDICGIINPGCNDVSAHLTDWTININSEKPLALPIPELASNTEPLKILQFTDIHLDLDYVQGKNANCGLPVCCRDGEPANASDTAGQFGHFSCALPVSALDAMYAHASTEHQDTEFIFLTGDYVHSGVWLYSPKENTRHIEYVTTKLVEAFPNTVIYPLTGNHEPDVVNMYAPVELWDQFDLSWMYKAVAEPFLKHIPSTELRHFMQYGYYSVTPEGHPNLLIIALNTNLCYINNFWLAYDPVDTGGQLQWFANTLGYAETLGQKVLVIGHIQPGSGSCWPVWSEQFNRIINRYEHIIQGQWYGHSHQQYYTLAMEDKTDRPISVSYVAGSGVTDGMNSAYNVYYVDGKRGTESTWEVMDQETWILNLTESNNVGEAKFDKLLSAKKDFGLKSLRPAGIYEFVNRMVCDDDLFVKYITVSAKGADSPRLKVCTDLDCKVGTLGEMVTSNSGNNSPYDKLETTIRTRDCSAPPGGGTDESGSSPRVVFGSFVYGLLSVALIISQIMNID